MSALLPPEAVTLLYRRYLKAAMRIPNVTIRMLLLQQVRRGFARNRAIASPSAQRELVEQAHKDLQILEDDRLLRTLYINRFGLVSCIEWEMRRTEFNFRPEVFNAAIVVSAFLVGVVFIASMHTFHMERDRPDIATMVDCMDMQLEANSAAELRMKRECQTRSLIERRAHQDTLHQRILATFYQAPQVTPSVHVQP